MTMTIRKRSRERKEMVMLLMTSIQVVQAHMLDLPPWFTLRFFFLFHKPILPIQGGHSLLRLRNGVRDSM